MKGKFITFEGSEGSGKSTQIRLAQEYLESKGQNVLFVREPGGVQISERIREILLDNGTLDMGDECETLLYMAARAQLVAEVIVPALDKGTVILCDRFLDSTVAYQGYGNGVDVNTIKAIGAFATRGCQPDLTFLFDIDVDEGFARIQRPKDRIENRGADYHSRVRAGYLAIAKNEPERVKIIEAHCSRDDIQVVVQRHLDELLKGASR